GLSTDARAALARAALAMKHRGLLHGRASPLVLPAQAKCDHRRQALQDKDTGIIHPDCSDDPHPNDERKEDPLDRAGFPSLESKRRPEQAESQEAVIECRVQADVRRLSGRRWAEIRETAAEIHVSIGYLENY